MLWTLLIAYKNVENKPIILVNKHSIKLNEYVEQTVLSIVVITKTTHSANYICYVVQVKWEWRPVWNNFEGSQLHSIMVS